MKVHHLPFLLFFLLLISCKITRKEKTEVTPLFQVGDTPVSTEDFIYVYEKNNYNNQELSQRQEILDYLELYINFKLKIKEAEELGLNQTEAFKQELDGYKKQLARPYLTESQVTDSLVEEAYKRLHEEVRASHILISVLPDAVAEDTLKAFKKIESIRNEALKNSDFNALAKEYSDDPSAQSNFGDLGYFTALQMVYPFEDAAYKTPVGSISQPVRTRFGYHILKVTDRRPSRGKIQVSHIMIRATEGIPAEDSVMARNKIHEIHNQLKEGANWNDLVKQFSDDINSKSQGGKLPWFGTGNMIPEFEEAAFNLQDVDDFSEPVKTAYGWHIIKLEDKKGLESFEELAPSLKAKVAKDSRSELNKIALIKRLKAENNVKENQENLNALVQKSDNPSFLEEFKQSEQVLFTIEDSVYRTGNFITYLKRNEKAIKSSPLSSQLKQLYSRFLEESLLQYEENNLERKYNDYRLIVNEYREGILLFQLMDEKVWSRALQDTAGLINFFNNNRDQYEWKERLDAVIYNASDESTLNKLKPLLGTDFISLPGETVSFNVPKNRLEFSSQEINFINQMVEKLRSNPDLLIKISSRAPVAENKNNDKRFSQLYALFQEKGIAPSRIIEEKQTGNVISFTFEVGGKPKAILEKIFNKDQPLALQIEEGPFERGSRPILEEIPWEEGTHTVKKDGRVYFIIVNKIMPPALKELNEVRGLAISDYQNFLEKEWVSSLKNKYAVQVNEDSLEKVFKRFEAN